MIRKNFFVNKRYARVTKLGLILAITASIVSCSGSNDDELVGNWVKVGAFSGIPRTSATGTTVDGLGYIGLGYNYTKDERLKDFWEYHADNGTWDQLPDFPGDARTNAVSFAASGKLYVGTGFNGTNGIRMNDFYEYDPSSKEWTPIASLDVDGREGMTAFAINNIGYVLGGEDADGTAYKDMYAYNPATDTWSKVADFGGDKRTNAVAFVINDIADDFYKYDPTAGSVGTWTKLREISDRSDDSYDDDYNNDIQRYNAVAFVSGGKGYIATGGKGSSGSDVWEYTPSTDLWVEKTSFEGASRYDAVAFTINDIGYVLTGQQGTTSNFDDMYRFEPNAEYEEND
jgi:N-acetylneuraminic acid mutarotase